MKTIRKLTAILLSIVMLTALLIQTAAGADTEQADEPVFLLLGDSIAEAYGIWNRDEACYGRIVADTDHFLYRNLAYAGADSADLLEDIDYWEDAESSWYNLKTRIKEADIICMCIGANDFFNRPDTDKLLVGALFGVNKAKLDAIADQYYENLCAIMDRITTLNPDAVILVQTVYCIWYGLAANANRALSERVNAMIEKYDRTHPGVIHICDVAPAMNGQPQNLADDCVHPNARGNVAIARVILQTLYDLGLGTETEPSVNVPGVDCHFFMDRFGRDTKGMLLTALVMLITGNGANIMRLFR